MIEPARSQEVSDLLEIETILTRYCTAIDTKQYDMLDSLFTTEATLDYTSAQGIRGTLHEAKAWLAKVLARFPMTQHVVGNFTITVEVDRASSRCSFFNPMGLPLQEGEERQKILFFGGYYNDTLVRTENGWRISERVEELTWNYGLDH
ncbi:MAG: nuclear transport factor 2 family protein [Proteobacteria bacterium]|nr:nuclear transport factor 2 family protein [Pseudomonadota bacterium]